MDLRQLVGITASRTTSHSSRSLHRLSHLDYMTVTRSDSTFRRQQLIDLTIDLISEYGYAYTSLQRIADAASISKATVLYHFANKSEIIQAAYESVLTTLTGSVRVAVEAAETPAAAVEAYLTSMLGYIATNPAHARLMIRSMEAADSGVDGVQSTPARWAPLAELIAQAQTTGQYASTIDPRAHAVALGGAIDALINESHIDPTFALEKSTATLLALARSAMNA